MLEPLGNNLVEILRRRAQEHPEKVAYIFLEDGEKREDPLTYGELDRRARAIAAQLEKDGLSGERALLLYPPGLDFIGAFFGCLYAGVIAVPLIRRIPIELTERFLRFSPSWTIVMPRWF